MKRYAPLGAARNVRVVMTAAGLAAVHHDSRQLVARASVAAALTLLAHVVVDHLSVSIETRNQITFRLKKKVVLETSEFPSFSIWDGGKSKGECRGESLGKSQGHGPRPRLWPGPRRCRAPCRGRAGTRSSRWTWWGRGARSRTRSASAGWPRSAAASSRTAASPCWPSCCTFRSGTRPRLPTRKRHGETRFQSPTRGKAGFLFFSGSAPSRSSPLTYCSSESCRLLWLRMSMLMTLNGCSLQ